MRFTAVRAGDFFPAMITEINGCERGYSGYARCSFALVAHRTPPADFALPSGLSEQARTSANGRPDSTSWGSLVRAQYRPLPESPTNRAFAIVGLGTSQLLEPRGNRMATLV
jgi:hypothetical protein